MISFNEALKRINQQIEGMVYEDKPSDLYTPIEYILSLGGKRIRPALVLLAYNLYKDDVEKTLDAAVGWEVFHNFTLLHDDLMDKADKRRGQATVHKKWNDNTAILSGDAMLILAYRYISKAPAKELKAVLDLFSSTAAEICGGQQYDMEFEARTDVSAGEYLEMIRLKTAVMLGACLKTGAILAEAPEADAEKLYDFGINIGLAFQLKDDLLDVFGNPDHFGKNIGGDILCNKKTFLLIHALQLAEGKTQEELASWLAVSDSGLNEKKIQAVTDIYLKLGLKELTEQKMQEYYEKAVEALNTLPVAPERKAILQTLAAELMERTI